jgi:hypothetical protein
VGLLGVRIMVLILMLDSARLRMGAIVIVVEISRVFFVGRSSVRVRV